MGERLGRDRVSGAAVVDAQQLPVLLLAEGEPSVDAGAVALGVEVEREEDRVAGSQRELVQVRVVGALGARHEAHVSQDLRVLPLAVRLDLGGRSVGLHVEHDVVGQQLPGRRGVHAQVVRAGGGDLGSGDTGRVRWKGAVVIVDLELRAVRAEQRQPRVSRLAARLAGGGDHGGEHAVSGLGREAIEVDVIRGARRPDALAGRDRRRGLRRVVRLEGLAPGRRRERCRLRVLGGRGAGREKEREQGDCEYAGHGGSRSGPADASLTFR